MYAALILIYPAGLYGLILYYGLLGSSIGFMILQFASYFGVYFYAKSVGAYNYRFKTLLQILIWPLIGALCIGYGLVFILDLLPFGVHVVLKLATTFVLIVIALISANNLVSRVKYTSLKDFKERTFT